MSDLLARYAGKKARVLHRNLDKSTLLQVEDEHDEVLVTVWPDGSLMEERIGGLAGIREAWEAAEPPEPRVLVPDDVTGRKRWTNLEESEPEPEPGLSAVPPEHAGLRGATRAAALAEKVSESVKKEPAKKKRRKREPAPVPAVSEAAARTARAVAMQVHASGSRPRDRFFAGQSEAARAETERALNHAAAMNWVAVSGDRIVKGAVSPHPMTALPTENDPAWGPSRLA